MKVKKEKNLLDVIPDYNKALSWTYDENRKIVTLDMIHHGFFPFLSQKIFGRPRLSHISLDDFGSFVWMQIDGKKNVLEIGTLVKEKYGQQAEPLYERLTRFFFLLYKYEMIDYRHNEK